MKKSLIVLTLILALGIGTFAAYADSAKPAPVLPSRFQNVTEAERDEWLKEREEWFKDRTDYRKEELEKALKNGTITEAEYKEWSEHFQYMDEFHSKNGIGGFGGGFGCGRGMGMGMMRGNGFGFGGGMRGNRF